LKLLEFLIYGQVVELGAHHVKKSPGKNEPMPNDADRPRRMMQAQDVLNETAQTREFNLGAIARMLKPSWI